MLTSGVMSYWMAKPSGRCGAHLQKELANQVQRFPQSIQIMVISVGFLLELVGKALLQKKEKHSVPELEVPSFLVSLHKAGSCCAGSLEGKTVRSSPALDTAYYNSNLLSKRDLLTQ